MDAIGTTGRRHRIVAAALAACLLAVIGVAPVAADTSARFPSSNTTVTLPEPQPPLSNPEHAYADDGVYASGDLTGRLILGQPTPGHFAHAYGDFGFDAIPGNAVITSVTAQVQYKFTETGASSLEYDVILFTGSDAFSGTVLSFAQGSSEPTADAVLTTTPVAATRDQLLDGALGVEVSASAGYGSTQTMLIDYVSVTVDYTVPNQAPVLAPIGDQTVGAGTIKTVSISANDGDGDPLQFGIGPHPSFVAFTDNGNGSATMTLSPVAGDIGASPYTVRVGVTDGTDSDYEDVTITVVADTTPPVVTVPADVTQEATGPSGAVVTFVAFGTDAVDGDLNAICTPPSGSTFPIGETTVTCEADDLSGNTGSASFKVTVVDTTPPAVTAPADVTVIAPDPVAVTYGAASATDLVDGDLAATCLPASGSTFALGATTVTCTATDQAGNQGSATFTVTVTEADTTPPVVKVPKDITRPATNRTGATVAFSVTATDAVDGTVPVTCTPASGSLFPVGTTTVRCTATDQAGNRGSASFRVRITEYVAPSVSVPPTASVGEGGPGAPGSGLWLVLAAMAGSIAFVVAATRGRRPSRTAR